MNLTQHFTLEELIASQQAIRLGIKNEPSTIVLDNLRATAASLENVRAILNNNFISVSSGYRSFTLNRAIGGSANSAHCLGFAVDFTCPQFGTPLQICKAIMASPLKYDQLIFEGVTESNPNGSWVHISFDPKLRGEDLTATFKNGKVTYSKGIIC